MFIVFWMRLCEASYFLSFLGFVSFNRFLSFSGSQDEMGMCWGDLGKVADEKWKCVGSYFIVFKYEILKE